MVNPLWVGSLALEASGIALLVLTHFGVLTGGLVIGPILMALGIGVTAYGAGAHHPLLILGIVGFFAILLELVFYFDIYGLGGGI